MTIDSATLREAARILADSGSQQLSELAELLPKLLRTGKDKAIKPWQYAEVFAQARDENPSPKTCCYMRKSTEGEDRQEFTLHAQKGVHEANISRLSLPAPLWFLDKASAASNLFVERTAGLELIRLVNPGDIVQVTHWDRAFRNVSDGLRWVEQWSQTGIRLLILDFAGMGLDFGNPISEFIITLLAGVAQLESRQNGERQRTANVVRREFGERMSSSPGPGYCFRKQHVRGKLRWKKVPHLEERKVVFQIKEMRDQGETVEQIRVKLRSLGIRRADTNKEWCKGAIHNAVIVDFEAEDARLKLTVASPCLSGAEPPRT